MHLLLKADSTRYALISVSPHFVPEDLTAERNQVVRVGPGHIDAARLQILLGRDKTLW